MLELFAGIGGLRAGFLRAVAEDAVASWRAFDVSRAATEALCLHARKTSQQNYGHAFILIQQK